MICRNIKQIFNLKESLNELLKQRKTIKPQSHDFHKNNYNLKTQQHKTK